uniref:hypothetical protein n=1 Tax=Gluconobacter thailandicus TaxID=257438 RepID=UPI0012E7FF53|nr:hypothetical protein [Gluconobacter thailandicus]
MFQSDQEARQGQNIPWNELKNSDSKRREEIKRIINKGDLHTANDYYRASFIEQHGLNSDDYLLAHTLATTALVMGCADARWIVAATLDRYLWSIGKSQIYGTQTQNINPDGKEKFTQEPFNRLVINDEIRGILRVPGIKVQERNIKNNIFHQEIDAEKQ